MEINQNSYSVSRYNQHAYSDKPIVSTNHPQADSPNEKKVSMFKEILSETLHPQKGSIIEGRRIIFSKYGYDTSADDHKKNKFSSALSTIKAAANKASASTDLAETFINQRALVDTTKTSLEKISTHKDYTVSKTNCKYLQYKAMIAKASKEDSENNPSYKDFWDKEVNAVDSMKKNYLDVYAKLMEQYTEMYQDYNQNIQQAEGGCVTGGKDGNTVHFKDNLSEAYKTFENKWLTNSVYKIDLKADDAQEMADSLKPAFNVDDNGNVTINLTQFEAMVKNNPLPAGVDKKGEADISTTSYQAWLATFNANGTALQSNMEAFSQRYSEANSTFDNESKLISSSISAMGDIAKQFFDSL
ncbi:invasin D [Izhakiella capsodis]|uniref:Invasin D n=1 Tax=Izhakiella capsodis TaxID=1367852 RepID=A0A1I5AW93_9GAMM|nr:IpaD/SipD/SspD family type III secretion system needle tip protein [Izhakiella capsodis]SFN66786.1 invasin D [Izhakiella capsodis]